MIDKNKLVSRIQNGLNALEAHAQVAELLRKLDPQSAAAKREVAKNEGAREVLTSLLGGIVKGNYDADVRALPEYTEADEDMDEDAPEEEPGEGIMMLPPCPDKEQQLELIRWARDNGFTVVVDLGQ